MPDPIPVFPPRAEGTVQWVDRRGRVLEHRGPLVDLGVGIPRAHRSDAPSSGIRRAIYDLAFGYVSGFPLVDVLRFSLRSLWPSPVLDARLEFDDDGRCPVCGAGPGEPHRRVDRSSKNLAIE